MNQTQWWPGVVFILVLFVPTIFIAIRGSDLPPTVRRDRPTWVVLSAIFGPAVIFSIAAVLAWWLDSIWSAIVGISFAASQRDMAYP